MKIVTFIFLGLSLLSKPCSAKSFIDAKFRHLSTYLFNAGRLRHSEYELEVTQTSKVSKRVTTVIQGRARANLALMRTPWALGNHYDSEVIKNEQFQFDGRALYLDYLTHAFRLKVGLQRIDWAEFFNSFSSDLLTPYDLRFAGSGSIDSNLLPTLSGLMNHKLGSGTLEYLVTPIPKHNRFPKEENGYGYYSYIKSLFAPNQVTIVEEDIKDNWEEPEVGIRYLVNVAEVDFSILALYGHTRNPIYQITPLSPGNYEVKSRYPRVLTLGLSANLAQDAWVARIFTYIEPKRTAKLVVLPIDKDPKESRYRFGGGFDYVFSEALKLYSEVFATLTHSDQTQSTLTKDKDYQLSLRLTNESLRKVLISLNSTFSFPKSSFVITPEITYDLNQYTRLGFGGAIIKSTDPLAVFESIKDTSRVYATLEYNFDIF